MRRDTVSCLRNRAETPLAEMIGQAIEHSGDADAGPKRGLARSTTARRCPGDRRDLALREHRGADRCRTDLSA